MGSKPIRKRPSQHLAICRLGGCDLQWRAACPSHAIQITREILALANKRKQLGRACGRPHGHLGERGGSVRCQQPLRRLEHLSEISTVAQLEETQKNRSPKISSPVRCSKPLKCHQDRWLRGAL
jgi:hypothetical protein